MDSKILDRGMLSTFEVAELLGRSPGAIRNLVMRRVIPHRKVAGRLTFLRREIMEWVDKAPGVRLEDLE